MGQPKVSLPADFQPTRHVIRDSAMALVPDTLEPFLRYYKSLWTHGPVNAAELEIMRLRNARKVNCTFCKATRFEEAKNAGLYEEKVRLIDDDYMSSGLSTREKLIIEYTDQYFDNPDGMTQDLRSRINEVFSKEEIVHLSTSLVMFNTMSRVAVTIGGMPDELPLIEMAVPD